MSSKSGTAKAGNPTKKKQGSKEWNGKLSNRVKAEVLASMLHLMSCSAPEIFDQFPEWIKERTTTALMHCLVEIDEFEEKHFTQLHGFMDFLASAHPNHKMKRIKNANRKRMSRKD